MNGLVAFIEVIFDALFDCWLLNKVWKWFFESETNYERDRIIHRRHRGQAP